MPSIAVGQSVCVDISGLSAVGIAIHAAETTGTVVSIDDSRGEVTVDLNVYIAGKNRVVVGSSRVNPRPNQP